jgi:hypothetical protein
VTVQDAAAIGKGLDSIVAAQDNLQDPVLANLASDLLKFVNAANAGTAGPDASAQASSDLGQFDARCRLLGVTH